LFDLWRLSVLLNDMCSRLAVHTAVKCCNYICMWAFL